MDCIFCRIVTGEAPADIVHREDDIIAFRDINPQAPVHVLIVPREHIAYLSDLSGQQAGLVGRLADVANQLARRQSIADRGYRVVINCGQEGGQLVPHLHMHLLGGRTLSGSLG
jgi:histidine triad (HIT) family protein